MATGLRDFSRYPWYYQILTVAVICAAVLGAVWYQFIGPMEEQIEAKTAQLDALQQTIAQGRLQQQRLAEFKRESEQLEVQLEELKSILPLEKETDQLLRSIQQTATSSALRVLRVGPRPIVDYEVYTEWPVDMEVVGTYHNIGTFLDRIRQLPRIVNIGGLRIQSRAAEGELAFSESVSATYTATTFVYREDPELAPVPR